MYSVYSVGFRADLGRHIIMWKRCSNPSPYIPGGGRQHRGPLFKLENTGCENSERNKCSLLLMPGKTGRCFIEDGFAKCSERSAFKSSYVLFETTISVKTRDLAILKNYILVYSYIVNVIS